MHKLTHHSREKRDALDREFQILKTNLHITKNE